ncbi:MAG TPA: NAD(P)-dependent oxidoreductase [Bacteroidia bacterium]|nr:NAD(P)-dependent oxidoreductase [Bacteroidia bacterium]
MKGKTIFITGGSRGIGKAIALRLAREGANIVIAAKTTEPHPKLEGTIFSAATEIEQAGGKCLPVKCDIRDEEQVVNAVGEAVKLFGGIDVLVNNASAINLTQASNLPLKQYDLMQDINTRGTFIVTHHCIPHLKKSSNPHIVVLSPPVNMDKQWFSHFSPYTISKYGMSMLVLGFSEELKKEGIGVNSVWPKTLIATAAVQNVLGGDEMVRRARRPEIVADAIAVLLKKNSREVTGNFFIDEELLSQDGPVDFTKYNVDPKADLLPDIFL